ncbi:MAG: CDP-glycerol glycerophosphotransferase family protein [Clostridia bacterium]|nr:CDP-glycerol glycerophosphotransferase family protein [Clostridia bacterium]
MNIVSRNIHKLLSKKRYNCKKRDFHTWVFGEWFGTRCCDNCLYLANHVAATRPEIRVVWIAKKQTDTRSLASAIQVVEMDSPKAIRLLQSAGVFIMNQGFVDFTENDAFEYYFSGALTINLWHGMPWKKIGNDMVPPSQPIKRRYSEWLLKTYGAQYYLSVSGEMTRIMKSAFGVEKNRIIEAGYPRNTLFYHEQAMNECRHSLLETIAQKTGTQPERILAYMPTFRDKQAGTFSFQAMDRPAELQALLEAHNAVIIEKAHFVNRDRADLRPVSNRVIAMNDIAAQELLAAADMLITDYSSCFFDFLATDRPILHYVYDYDDYAHHDRGLYFGLDEVACGDTPQTQEALLAAIQDHLTYPAKGQALRAERRRRFMSFEQPGACEAIAAFISQRCKENDI